MTRNEAYQVLGLQPGAEAEAIKAAYRAEAKRHHPDLNGGGEEAAARFRRVQEAYETLMGRNGVGRRDQADADDEDLGGSGEDAAQQARPDPVAVVREFLTRMEVVILFDGTAQVGKGPRMAEGPAGIDAWLAATPEVGPDWIVDEVMLEVRRDGLKLAQADVERALRKIVREDQKARRNVVVGPLLKAVLGSADRARAESEWTRLVAGAFEGDTALCVAVLQHLIWQVKRKLLGHPVRHHLMPIVSSPLQGTGKTTFVLKFLGPLKELAAGPALLSDFADRRSGDIYRYPVVFVDDVERIDARLVPSLKQLATGDGFHRRKLHTSMSVKLRQLATLIGTANEGIDKLIADETGHRRFVALRFKNGAVATGGDPAVWDAVGRADYELLWRSVYGFGPSPIEPHLAALAAAQAAARPRDPLTAWLHDLDVTSEAVLRITKRNGVPAKRLWELFCEQTDTDMTLARFGTEMKHLAADPKVPFGPKIEVEAGTLYPLKRRPSPDDSPGFPGSPASPGCPGSPGLS